MIFPAKRRKNEVIRAKLPEIQGILNGQRLAPLGEIPFGHSTVGFSGCESIAVHNLLVLLGRSQSYQSVLRTIERDCWLFGWFGIFPHRISKSLSRVGISARKTADRDELIRAVSDGFPVILSYWTKRRLFSSIHTVCVYSCEDGTVLLNCFSRCADAALANDFTAWMRSRLLITGYIPDERSYKKE